MRRDRKSTRLNSSHLSLHDALPICATSQPFAVEGFSGSVSTGASCNCRTISLTPHCNGTHTECAGHLIRDLLDAHRVIPAGLVPALVVSVTPDAARSEEHTSELQSPIPTRRSSDLRHLAAVRGGRIQRIRVDRREL